MIKYTTKEETLKAIKKDSKALKYASEELQNDKEIVFAAIKQNYKSLQFTSRELRELFSINNIIVELIKYELNTAMDNKTFNFDDDNIVIKNTYNLINNTDEYTEIEDSLDILPNSDFVKKAKVILNNSLCENLKLYEKYFL